VQWSAMIATETEEKVNVTTTVLHLKYEDMTMRVVDIVQGGTN